MQAALQEQVQRAQQTPPRLREAEAQLQVERERIDRLMLENAALSERAHQLQLAAAQPAPFQNQDLTMAVEQAYMQGRMQVV